MRRALALLLLAMLALLDGCGCRKKTDEEILRGRIDATPVHLWLGTKIALHPDGGDADVKEARKALTTLIRAAEKRDVGEVDVAPKDAAALAVSLWKLRGLGKDAFAKNDVAVPRPFLGRWIEASGASAGNAAEGELDRLLDAKTEHAALLIGLTIAKVHPKLAVPVPPEILLYEAYWTRPDEVSLQSLGAVARGFKAYVYGTSELCDLAQREADAIPTDKDVFSGEILAHDLGVLTGSKIKSLPADSEAFGALVSTLGNGATAICFFQRDEPEKANKPLRRVLDTAERQGLDGYQTVFLRGYVECADGDAKLGAEKLHAVIDDPKAPKTDKQLAKTLLQVCGKKVLMAKAVNRVALGAILGALAFDLLDKSGLIDELMKTSVARSIKGVVTTVGNSIHTAKSAVPSYQDAEKSVKGWFGQ